MWTVNNKQVRSSISKKYYDKNKNAIFANMAARRARKLKAMPLWLTAQHKQAIKDMYKNRPKGYEVDHIVPLRGKLVSGLHVPWNLQYLTIEDNRRKGSKYG